MLARRERVADIMASRQWLLQQPWVAQDRISLIGWANGASALLWAVRPQLAPRKAEPDFRSAVAFYPDCRISSGLGWSARVPTLVLIGASDDVSSPAACRQMVDGARGRSALARIVVYPGAVHDFDRANFPLHAIGRNATPACRSAAISAPTPTRAPIRKSASRSGWRDRRFREAGVGEARDARTNCPDRPAWRRAWARRASARCAAAFGSLARRCVAAGRSASAVAPTRPSANSRSSRAPGPTLAAARTRVALLVAHQRKTARQHALDRTAPPATGRYGRCAPAGAASRSPARGARVRPAAARVRGRARWRCAAPARWRALRPSAGSQARQNDRGGGAAARAPKASSARRPRSGAARPARPARAAPAASAAR